MSSPYLIIGGVTSAMVTKIVTAEKTYDRKLLESKPDNWRKIIDLLQEPDLMAVIVTLTAKNYEQIDSEEYAAVASKLLEKVSSVPHLVLIHEAVLGGARSMTGSDEESWDGVTWNDTAARQHFGDIDEALRLRVNNRVTEAGIRPVTYKRNLDISALASNFLDDSQNNLMFRIYIPSGKLFEEESSEILSMFHNWLLQVRGRNIRRGGYQTAKGRVVEFFAEDNTQQHTWSEELETFTQFISIIDNTTAATTMIQGLGIDQAMASALVSTYSKKLKRIQLDAKHEREQVTQKINASLRMNQLQTRQALESDLLEYASDASSDLLERMLDQLIPASPEVIPLPARLSQPHQLPLQINQQFFNNVEGVVAQHISGNITNNAVPAELMSLIQRFGNEEAQALTEATQELADTNAPPNRRIQAKQFLKAFTMKLADKVTDVGITIAQKWLEQQTGISS
ncbi:hypothetical protein [Arthrobacter alpinus]|uniref:hypothetical protein n=1 Tax=Arthrobacter alpinus TaxID=656366 RepID=UPI00101AE2AE|nr:hypothetical protein [Arthrobacter alpinus]